MTRQSEHAPAAHEGNRAIIDGLVGSSVLRCCVDDALTVECRGTGGVTRIRLDGEFDLRLGSAEWRLNADARPRELGPAMGLIGRVVVHAHVDEGAHLRLDFSDDWHMTVPPDDVLQSWELTSGGRSIACLPEGNIVSTRVAP